MRVEPLTESSCIAYLGDQIDPALSDRACRAAQLVRERLGPAVVDVVPAYASVHVTLDPARLPVMECCRKLESLLSGLEVAPTTSASRNHFEIPAYYGTDAAPDLQEVAQRLGLEPDEVIRLHAGAVYRVYAIGFAPGFCFLGLTDGRLRLPRRARPRTRVPAGSIAIADRQTAVYPLDTPGGWHLIGRTTADMLALCNDPQRPLRVGDEVRFRAVDRDAFLHAGGSP